MQRCTGFSDLSKMSKGEEKRQVERNEGSRRTKRRTFGAIPKTFPHLPVFLNSAPTAPIIREPIISPFWFSSTQALSSNLIVRPSGRAMAFFVLHTPDRAKRGHRTERWQVCQPVHFLHK